MSATDPATDLREQIESPGITVLPGAYDALSARLAEQAGFDAAFTSGFGLSASTLGVPDLGLLTRSQNTDLVRQIADAVDVPLLADMDTGYGNALNVRRTVDECIDAGVGGIILEDQQWPKRCGHMNEKRVVDTDDHAARIRAAADVRDERDSDLVIVGRTDAREPLGMDAAIERGRAYAEAGADVVFLEAPEDREELDRAANAFDVPTLANMIEGGKTPFLPTDEVEDIGFDAVVYPLSSLFAATAAVSDAFERLADEGTTAGAETVSFEAFESVVDAPAYRELAARYE